MKKIQYDKKDCGLYVLKYFCDLYFWNSPNISDLKNAAWYGQNGVSISELKKLAEKYGINVESYNCEFDNLLKLDAKEFPIAVVVNNQNNAHLVVIKKIVHNTIYLYNPAYGDQKIEINLFKKCFLNVLISFKKDQAKIEQNEFKNKKLVKMNKLKAWFLVMLLCESVLVFVFPFLNKYLLQTILPNKLSSQLFLIILTIVWITLTFLVFKLIMQRFTNEYLKNEYQKYYEQTYQVLKNNRYKYLNKFSILELKNKFNLFYTVTNYNLVFLPMLINSVVCVIFSFVLLFRINFWLLIAIMVYLLISFLLSWWNKIIYTNNYKNLMIQNWKYELAFSNLLNGWKNDDEIHLLQKLENEQFTQFHNLQAESLLFKNENTKIGILNDFLELIAPFLVIIVGLYQVWKNELNFYDLIFFISAASLFTRPVKNALPLFTMFQENKCNQELLAIFDIPITNDNHTCPSKIDSMILSYIDFDFIENKTRKLINIDHLEIFDKHIFQGKNGSGKSTLCRIISGYLPIQNGEISINNEPINLYLNENYQAKTFLVTTNKDEINCLITDYLCIESLDSLYRFLKVKGLDQWIELLKEIPIEQNTFNSISLGQQQIIKLTKIFIFDFQILIFDEAFESLSSKTFETVKEILIKQLQHKIVIEVSHNNKYIFNQGLITNV
ncbi:Mbov_0121 family peptidase domain-containing ABC transporter [Mycoplasma hafezii]|uniref:Mbov_0121 family peptidase domain-containing ABC transporter n=1 Tax=Mycoplasma hafezii TaxID=525886 RepID=UPI003CF30A9F